MSRPVTKTLSFPLAGVARRSSYRKQERPYATPYAVNVRGEGSLERRERGGSRAGLVKLSTTSFASAITAVNAVTSINDSGTRVRNIVVIAGGALYNVNGSTVSQEDAELYWPDGEAILWDDGQPIVFDSTVSATNPVADTGAHQTAEHGGKLYLADSTLRYYDPLTGVVSEIGEAPSDCPLICVYRDRLILAKDHLWYASRSGTFTDWDFGATMEDNNRAVAGATSFSGLIGQPIKAVIPYRDHSLIFACENSLWALTGDPATGMLRCLSAEVGIIAPEAWALSPNGLLAFLSNDGIYVGNMTDPPKRFSEERIPGQLRNIDPTSTNITMQYNMSERGFNLYAGFDNCWFLDVRNKAFWKDSYASGHLPSSTTLSDGNGLRKIILGCADGYLRTYSDLSANDDGTLFQSSVVIGPFRIAADDVRDAMLTEIHGILADNSSSVKWSVFLDNSAEVVTDKALDLNLASSSGSWLSNRNPVFRPRCRGSWCAIRLDSHSQWSYEAIAIVARQLGRLR